ncbi:MAG TPA: RsmE family RNA methyltransferase [Ilumatobacter sp.]|nr:RsmE family RNA methyltransferase [Ilumatobacter sp.]
MTPEASDALRRASAHALVTDVEQPLLDDDAAHHVFRVLRVGDGALITVTDGAGSWRLCRAAGGNVRPDGDVGFEARRDPPITVGFAVPKLDRPEWIVQKLTEVGVDRIVVLHAERSVVRWAGDRADKQLAKLRRTAIEAIQQSRQVWLPAIEGPTPAAQFLPRAVAAEPGGRPLTATDHSFAVGPEGGWSDAELEVALDRVSIGSSVLRVETAAIAVAVLATIVPFRVR